MEKEKIIQITFGESSENAHLFALTNEGRIFKGQLWNGDLSWDEMTPAPLGDG